MEEFLWSQKYRPEKVSDCILPDRIKNVFQACVDERNIPNMLLTGTAGVGKTTVAIAMVNEIDLNCMFINSSKERGIDTLRTKIVGYASTVALKPGRKVIILDEADYLTPEAQAALRGTIEEFSTNATFIFTCNFKSRLIDAIHSRCTLIDFTLKTEEKAYMAAAFMKRLEFILKNEKVEYDKTVLARFVEKYFPDYRRTLNELQRHAQVGPIDAGVLAQVSDIRKIGELVKAIKEKNFKNVRMWVAANIDLDPAKIYRKIYDSLYEYVQPDSIPAAVVILSKYQYQAAFVSDQEINLVACLTELMVECDFK